MWVIGLGNRDIEGIHEAIANKGGYGMRTARLVVVVVMGVCPAAVMAADVAELKHLPSKLGEMCYLHGTVEAVGTIEGMGPTPQQFSQRIEQWMKRECVAVDAKGVTTERMTYERVAVTMSAGPMTTSYDSARPEAGGSGAEALGKWVGALVGLSIEGRIDADGRCIEVRGVKEMMEKLTAGMGGDGLAASMVQGMISEDGVKDKFGTASILPGRQVKVGEVWSKDRSMAMGPLGTLEMKQKFKLLAVEQYQGRRCARIGTTSSLGMAADTSKSGVPGMFGPMDVTMSMAGEQGKGVVMWDIDRGMLVQSTESMPLTTEMQMKAPTDANAPGMTVTQKLTTTTTVEMLDKLPAVPSAKMPTTGKAEAAGT